MAQYHIKTVRGRREKMHPCDGYTVTILPEQGHYREHGELLGLPQDPHIAKTMGVPSGQKVKFVLDLPGKDAGQVLYLPRDGNVAFVMNAEGDTIDTYPKRKQREMRAVETKET